MTEDKAKDATMLVLRVEEWGAYFAMRKDAVEPKLMAVGGETAIELKEGERLSDLEVVPTDQVKHVPVPASNNTQAQNIPMKLVVFRATLARVVKGPLPDKVEDKVKSKLITPHHRGSRK